MADKSSLSNESMPIYCSVIDTVRRISGEEPVIFQRDGDFYAVSSRCFGVVDYGLSTSFMDWEERPEWKKDEPEPLTRKYSKALEVEVSTPGMTRDLVGDNPELMYIQPFVSDPDGVGPSIDELAQAAKEFRELPENRMVYMLNHFSGYHSHKYGYACDGIDVVPSVGRVMEKEKFLELMAQCERGILEKMKATFEELGRGDRRTPETIRVYGNDCNAGYVRLPDAFVLTSNTFMSFIRRGEPHIDRDYRNNWTSGTNLYSSLISPEQMNGYEESPFGFYVRINSRDIFGKDANTLMEEQEKLTEDIKNDLREAAVSAKQVAPVIQKLNDLHNTLFAEGISWRKELRRESA